MANGWVEGIVKKASNGTPVSGAIVTVDGTSGSYTTGSNGYYIKQLPPCGAPPQCPGYTVRAKKSGYEGVAGGVHISSGTGTQRNITIPGL